MTESPALLSGRVDRRTMLWLIGVVLAGTGVEALTSSNDLLVRTLPLRSVLLLLTWGALAVRRISPLVAGRALLAQGALTALLWSSAQEGSADRVVFAAVAYGVILSIFALMVAPLTQRYIWAGVINLVVLLAAGLTLVPADTLVFGQAFAVLGVHFVAVISLDQYASRVQIAGELDPLTQLFNRRPMVDRLTRGLGSQGAGARSSLVIADLDEFKVLNDTLGHEAGDEALRRVAQVLRQATNPDDAVCRWGGEEFLVFLPNLDGDRAAIVAERLRTQISETGVTASIGVAESADGDTVSTWVGRADKAMYRAKRDGRDRVELAPRQALAPKDSVDGHASR